MTTAALAFNPRHLNLIRRQWRLVDRLKALRFVGRRATIPPASWVDELLQRRFGAAIICPACAWKYRDGLQRLGYAPHPDNKACGNACDFCKTIPPHPVPIWQPEERRYPSLLQLAQARARSVSPFPERFRGTQLPVARHHRRGSWVPPQARGSVICIP